MEFIRTWNLSERFLSRGREITRFEIQLPLMSNVRVFTGLLLFLFCPTTYQTIVGTEKIVQECALLGSGSLSHMQVSKKTPF